MSELADFSRLAMTLEPWRKQIVFVGGWAFRLYRYEPRAYTADHNPIFTQDADVAYDTHELLEGDIKKALEGAGFTEEPNLAGGFRPPAMRYNLGSDANGFYAEFLTPLTGSGRKRDGKGGWEEDATELHAGVVAQKLRFLEVLLYKPCLVTIPKDESGLDEAVADLRVPNPASFMIQKLLIRDKRVGQKRAQDVLYIHDTLQLFYGAIETDLVPIWKELEGTLHANQQKSVRDGVRELFSGMNDVIREAAAIPADKRDPEAMLQLCREGFEDLFGEV
ncbi:GSU2403 family nucleotidyltransferase fold protein [Paraburkholderia sp. JHI2823]|uniref:GSU2403 family nucleotidyltransferase fold protein n=1 Tax=Paraburkholderia sp. JHI2823 TaxID=3112960 RepID=UPI00316CD53A